MAICFRDFDAIGFDVDHALVRYKLENLFPLVYYSLAKYLVETKDYPEELVEEPFEVYADFCTRGIVLEANKGNFVKISKDGKVLRASHGTKILSEDKLKEEYGEEKTWEPFKDFLDGMTNKGGFFHGAKFRMFENFFDMPAMLLCARLIDMVDSQEAGEEKYRLIWPDVLASLIENFDYRSFKAQAQLEIMLARLEMESESWSLGISGCISPDTEDRGYFYPAIKADVHKYVHPCSDKLKTWLKKLRKEGKKLFLITNSQADFSMFVLENAFGKDWLSYFNVAVSRAGKPGFFQNQHHFLEVVNGVAREEEIRDLEEGKYYAEGNSTDLERFLKKLTGKTNLKLLFFGDSLLSDIYPPQYFSNWNTVGLLEELGVEINNSSSKEKEKNDICNGEPESKKAKPSEHSVENEDVKKRKDILLSTVWGSIFGEDCKRMNTLFSSLVESYGSLILPDLDCVTDLNTDYSFIQNFNGSSRFYPSVPEIIATAKTD